MSDPRPNVPRSGNALDRLLVDDVFSFLTVAAPKESMITTSSTQSIGYTPQKTKLTYYSPDPSWSTSNPSRISTTAALIRWPVTNEDFEFADVGTWAFSCIDFIFPGLSATILQSDPNITIEQVTLSAELVASKHVGAPPIETSGTVLPGLSIDVVCQSAEWLHIVGALTVLLFTLGKAPNEKNFAAFTDNRPKAIASKMGITIDQASPLAGARLPKLEHFRKFGGYFNMNYAQRRTLVRTLLAWCGLDNLTPDQTVVVTQVALWKNAGMTHLLLVKDFLRNYGLAVLKINGLRTEIKAFSNSWNAYRESTDSEKDFLRVIDGDRAQLGRSRDYAGLLNLAKSLAAVIDPRYKQYATGLGESPFQSEFIRICREMNYSLPEAYVSGTADVGTTGGGIREL